MRHALSVVCAALCVAALAPLARAEQVDNPAYQSWAKCKPGSTVTYKMTSEMKSPQLPSPMKSEMTITQTLKAVTPEAATIEITTKMTMNGQETTVPGNTNTVPAKIEKGKEGLPAEVQGEVSDMKTGKDTVEVNGKKYEATTQEYTVKMTQPIQMTSHVKAWNSAEVPGGMLKSETKATGPMDTTSTMTLVEFTQK
jgi:hypothetical protein